MLLLSGCLILSRGWQTQLAPIKFITIKFCYAVSFVALGKMTETIVLMPMCTETSDVGLMTSNRTNNIHAHTSDMRNDPFEPCMAHK